MKPVLSVIIVNFNTGKLLAECIASIKKNPNVEVIVVDNGSTDDSAAAVGKFQIISNKTNVGFAKAANQGIRKARGEYILLLNPDTKVKQGAIAEMLTFAQNTPDAGVVGAQLVNPDGSVQPSVFHFPTIFGAIKEFWLGQKGTYTKYIPTGSEPAVVDSLVGAAFLITPQACKRVGLLNERFWMYFEDLDYCRRVYRAGLKVCYLPSAQVVHYHGISGYGQEQIQYHRLVEASCVYHGPLLHSLINFVIWSGQKWQKFFKIQN